VLQIPLFFILSNLRKITAVENGGAVGWGTTLQIGRSLVRSQMMSLEFFIDINPSDRTMALESTQPPTEMSTRNISWGVKAASA
jgi:hypothetical protein